MSSSPTPKAKLNVLLIKDTVGTFKSALRDEHQLSETPLKLTIGDSSALFIKKPHQNPPSWEKFLKPISKNKLNLANASSSAILFVSVDKRIFAFCFGQGRNELKPDAIQKGFGLRVTLNRVDHEKLRSMDSRTLENGVTSKRQQTSRDADQSAFGLDVSRDLLRQVVGQPTDSTFATKLAGSDSLTIHSSVTAGGLGQKCKQLLKAYKETGYRTYFEWVDHLSEVTDPKLKDQLNNLLIGSFKRKKFENMSLAATSIVDWEDIDKFRIGGTRNQEYLDLSIEDYAAKLGPTYLADLSVNKLRSNKIKVQFAGNDTFFPQSSVYASLVWETKLNNQIYALVDGHWYEIDSSFAKRVGKYVSSIPTPQNNFLLDSKKGEKEGDYNTRIATASSELFLLDKKLVRPDGAASSIEFCDLFSKKKQLIHVKRKTRSATLSHLFAQGTVSAQLFVQDTTVRSQVKDVIRNSAPQGGFLSHIPDNRPNPEEYEVVYAIISKANKKWPLSLPFFSQVNLMHSCKQLEGLGFTYALQHIPEV